MKRVLVVGGGLAGITAALDLADAGIAVILLEVRPRLGGAAYSFEREGIELDNGQHVFLRCCEAYRALLRRLGVESGVRLQPRLEIPVLAPGGRQASLHRGRLPWPLGLVPSLLRYPFLTRLERLRLGPAALALARLDRDDPALDSERFGDWLRRHGQSERSIDSLWNLIALPTLNLPADEASLSLAAMVFQTGLLSRGDAGDVGYARVPLSRLHDTPAREALRRAGVDVRLRSRVERITQPPEGGFGVDLGAQSAVGDAVVLAVPHERAAALLPPRSLAAEVRPEQLGRSPIVNLHLAYDRRVTDLSLAAAVGSPVQWLFDRTSSSGVGHGQCLAISLSGARREMALSPAALRAEFVPAIARLLPAARDARLERFHVTREHSATFLAAPGSQGNRPRAQTRVPGLMLAGAWTATGWPATMEGAVLSGHAAAREVRAFIAPAVDQDAVGSNPSTPGGSAPSPASF
ncbi:MAG: hydroxysqualene dehydroxylase HpnE [Thermoleophilaceae bacterium]